MVSTVSVKENRMPVIELYPEKYQAGTDKNLFIIHAGILKPKKISRGGKSYIFRYLFICNKYGHLLTHNEANDIYMKSTSH